MLSDHLYQILKGITANVYPGVAPQELDCPFIVHNQVNMDPTRSKDGPSNVDYTEYNIGVMADDYLDTAEGLAKQIRTMLDGYAGSMYGSKIIQAALVNEESGFDIEANYYYVVQTYRIIERDLT